MNASPSDADPATSPDAQVAREIEILGKLAEIGLKLAEEIAEFTIWQFGEARQGWVQGLAPDPGAAHSRISQSVRRTIALRAHLREGREGRGSSLFAQPKSLGINLHPVPGPARAKAEPDDDRPDRPETLKADLGDLLDRPERFIPLPGGSTKGLIDGLCRDLGLDPALPQWVEGRWMVEGQPLENWRPPASPKPPASNPPDAERPSQDPSRQGP